MSKIIMICGKLCCGKSSYAEDLRRERGAVLLSVDEIMLALFGQDAGDRLDEYVRRTKDYLLAKSLELLAAGVDVVLDWGFWTRAERDAARAFCSSNGAAFEFHYLSVGDAERERRLQKRNREVAEGRSSAYFVDAGLDAKFRSLFEKPEQDEIDLWLER